MQFYFCLLNNTRIDLPVSKMPIIVSDPTDEEDSLPVLLLESIFTDVWYFKKSQERVVWSSTWVSGKTDTTPGFCAIERASSSDIRAANPEKPCL